MKILITGASGFIGSHLVEYALAQGHEVWAAVRSTTNRQYLQDSRIHFISLTLLKYYQLEEEIRQHVAEHGPFDHVIHAAGVTQCRHQEDFFEINGDAPYHLAKVMLGLKALRGRFVYISSLSALGPVREHDKQPLQPSDLSEADTAYGNSKLLGESGLRELEDLDYVTLRPTGVYGPRERDYFLMAKSIRRHVDFSVGFRHQALTFIYVDDLVQATFLALTQGPSRTTYHLSDGGTYSSRTFSRLLQAEMGVKWVMHIVAPIWVLYLVCWVAEKWANHKDTTSTLNLDKFRIMRQRNWRCDITPARELLGYRPQWPLERGVKATVAWYKAQHWL